MKSSRNYYLIVNLISIILFFSMSSCENNSEFEADDGFDVLRDFNQLPDGAKLFFLKGESENENEFPGTIYSVDANSAPKPLLTDRSFDKTCGNFDISRDGEKIVFASSRDDKWYIYVADLDLASNKATNFTRIPVEGEAQDPKLSFNGKEIVYKRVIRDLSDPSRYTGDICKCNISGTANKIITNTSDDDWAPVFSSDNKYIAFGRRTDRNDPPGDIILYDVQNSKEIIVTSTESHDWYPAFNYFGDLIYSRKDGNCLDDIFSIKRGDLTKQNVNQLSFRLFQTGSSSCDNHTEADPSIVYGNNNFLTYVSDKGNNPGKFDIYVHSFGDDKSYSILSHKKNRLLGPIIYVPNDLRKGLVAEWLFNGNASDGSGNNNNGTIVGATLTSDRKGTPSSAYLFDGSNDYIEFNHSESLNLSKEISVTFWVKFETYAPYYYPYHILEKYGSWGTGQRRNEIAWVIITPTKEYSFWTLDYGLSFEYNRYYFFALTYDGSKMCLYMNGILSHCINATGELVKNQNKIFISKYQNGGDYFFDGVLDDFHIYNRALNEAEISLLYD